MKAQKLVEILNEKRLSLGSVESMTGGLFASSITSEPGASAVFKGGLITYQAPTKEKLVCVRHETIETFGVISWEVANEMAYNGRALLDVDYCVAVTGNAGPTVDNGQKEVGTIFIAIASKDNVWGIPLSLQGSRNKIREQTVTAMSEALLSIIK